MVVPATVDINPEEDGGKRAPLMEDGTAMSQHVFCVPEWCQGMSGLSGKVMLWQLLLTGDRICLLWMKKW